MKIYIHLKISSTTSYSTLVTVTVSFVIVVFEYPQYIYVFLIFSLCSCVEVHNLVGARYMDSKPLILEVFEDDHSDKDGMMM